MWKYYKEKNIDPYSRANQIKVNQYDNRNNFIKSYNTISMASLETGVGADCIVRCCKHKYKTAGGFIWKYAN